MTSGPSAGSAVVAVVGAGTMGGGIAQVAAVAGHPVTVYDAVKGAAERAVAAIGDRVAQLVAKGRLDCDPAGLRLSVATELGELAPARCVIEAVAEDLAVKQGLFADLEKVVTPDCVLATNTSIDAVLTQAGGFRMGPFALMDLVGQDVNEAVTRSVWTAFGYDPRFAPSLLQRALVEAGWLGRKSGRGWYRYGDDAPPPAPDAAPSRPLARRWRGHRARRLATAHPAQPLAGGDPHGRRARQNGPATQWRAAGPLRRQAR